MPKAFILFLGIFALLCWMIPVSASISFVYENEYLLVTLVSYGVLFSIYICFVIFQHRIEKNQDKSFFQRLSIEKKLGFLVSSLIFPIMLGNALSLLTPLVSDLLASEFAIYEYKAMKVEPYASSFRNLSKLHVVDIKKNEISFVIKNEILAQLRLRESDHLVVRGRRCIAGFVIDNINGIERE